jgi:hypothetical protein
LTGRDRCDGAIAFYVGSFIIALFTFGAMRAHPLIFKIHTDVCCEFGDSSHIYLFDWMEVSFDRLSERGRILALSRGYSPAVPVLQEPIAFC